MGFNISFTPAGSAIEPTLIEAITTAGATSGLQVALDAGDVNSYSGTGQKWLDTSGNGLDFFFGEDINVTAKDPTFNGVAGDLSENEYMSYDGDDLFRLDQSNTATFNSFHKANSTYTIICMIWHVTNSKVCGTRLNGSPGMEYNGKVLATYNPGGVILQAIGDTQLNLSGWNFVSVTIDETGGDVSFITLNGAFNQVSASNTFDATMPSASAADAGNILAVGGSGIALDETAAGTRHGFFAVWDIALTKNTLDSIYNETKTRFGI